ncbi:MAG TPA: EAL domain-containing response regulator [Dongiaceae bacterium]|nr:EAL domain-containing response regulator [Dongiaceae bacterium]
MQTGNGGVPQLFVVDDEQGIRDYVSAVARRAGFNAQGAADSRELFMLLDQTTPAVIVLDLNMANTDGIQILSNLAARRLATQIVIFSGSDVRVLETAQQLGEQQGLTIAAALQKPIRKAELLGVFERIYVENEPFSASMLRRCLDEKRLKLAFQPKISLATYDVVGCEALLRCQDRAERPVAPEIAIGIAEAAGMIDDVSIWVFREAVWQCRHWRELGVDLSMAINLSPYSSCNPDLPGLFASICAEHKVPAEAITIELTESAAMDDSLISKETLIRLRVKGFKLSVDDFGTGYSSLLRLKQLPFTEIKVDKSFVMNLHKSRDDAAITGAIIQLAQNLDLHCVIEGAEDQQAMDFAATLGCQEAQGYFISKPLAGNDIPSFIKIWQWRKNAMPRKAAEVVPAEPQAAVDQSA